MLLFIKGILRRFEQARSGAKCGYYLNTPGGEHSMGVTDSKLDSGEQGATTPIGAGGWVKGEGRMDARRGSWHRSAPGRPPGRRLAIVGWERSLAVMLFPLRYPMFALAALLPVAGVAERQVRDADNAMLPCAGALLFNNVWNKGDSRGARQELYVEGDVGGWSWDWPENAGPAIKAYPEIVLGHSPWSAWRCGERLPAPLHDLRMFLDFDYSAAASTTAGSWATSFDFWITSSAKPTPKTITCNLNIWIQRHELRPPYVGKHETVTLGGRTYEAIIETPADNPAKAWNTLCLVDIEPRTSGTLDLGELAAFLIARGLAQPEHFLVTAELGNEVAFGKGTATIRKFALR